MAFALMSISSRVTANEILKSEFNREKILSRVKAYGTTLEPVLALLGRGAAEASYEALLQTDYIISQNNRILKQNIKIIELLESIK